MGHSRDCLLEYNGQSNRGLGNLEVPEDMG